MGGAGLQHLTERGEQDLMIDARRSHLTPDQLAELMFGGSDEEGCGEPLFAPMLPPPPVLYTLFMRVEVVNLEGDEASYNGKEGAAAAMAAALRLCSSAPVRPWRRQDKRRARASAAESAYERRCERGGAGCRGGAGAVAVGRSGGR